MIALAGLGAAAAPLFVAVARDGGADGARAVFFAPSTVREHAIDACLMAGWRVLRSGLWANVVVAIPLDGAPNPSGAWFSLSIEGLGACLDGAGARQAA